MTKCKRKKRSPKESAKMGTAVLSNEDALSTIPPRRIGRRRANIDTKQVARLARLGFNWKLRDRSVLVLQHSNVALPKMKSCAQHMTLRDRMTLKNASTLCTN